MILSNVAIAEALDDGRLVVEPPPKDRTAGSESQFNTSSLDLLLSPDISVPKAGMSIAVDPSRGSLTETLSTLYESHVLGDAGFALEPGQFILARTVERVTFPILDGNRGSLAARVEGRSSLARLGLLVHFTAPTIHAGFSGTITLEMINLGPSPVVLKPYMRICQLIIEEVSGIPYRSDSRFQGQGTPTGQAS